jgi:biopolymer transport protein ExbB
LNEVLQTLFDRGGPIMWPLLGCSLVSLTITIERLLFWWHQKCAFSRNRIEAILDRVDAKDYDGAANVKGMGRDAVSSVLAAGLRHREHGLSEAMQVEAGSRIDAMKQGLSVLDTIVTMAPLLGILGTVLGIIASFDLLGASGIEDPKAVTGGIAQALITTAAGLTVAIVSLIPLNYFVARTQRETRRLEQIATQFEVACRRNGG